MWFWRIILRLIKPYAGYAFLSASASLFSVVFSLVSLAMILPFLDLLFSEELQLGVAPALHANPEAINAWLRYQLSLVILDHGREGALFLIVVTVVVLFFLKNLFRYLGYWFIAPLRNRVIRNLRNALYDKILILPLSYYSDRRSGDILSRISSDVLEVEWSVMSFLIMLFRHPIALLLFIGALVFISPSLTLFAALLLPLAGWVISLAGKWLNRMAARGQEKVGGLVSQLDETISGIRIIKSFNAIGHADARFREANEDFTRLLTRVYRQRDLAMPLTETLAILAMVSVIWFGGRQVLSPGQSLDAQVFLLYLAVFSQIIAPARALISAYYYIRKGEASMRRIQDILDAPEVITEKEKALGKKDFRSGITFRNVHFSYGGEEVLCGIDLELRKGESVAVVGPSGSGKTTLLNLIPRFYDPEQGQVLLDGEDIRNLRIHDLRGLIGMVSQDTILFNDSIRNNIAFGKEDASLEDIRNAARVAQADDFIREMPQAYDTAVGDRGLTLSGGQRQRLAIARAVLRNPPILLLDEATSALDQASEQQVQEALTEVMKERTSLIVAHRLATVRHADRIVVLGNGKIIEEGSHESLLAAKGTYHQMWVLQQG